MAILGYQLVSTLIGISLLTKLSVHFSFTSVFVFGGIYRSLLPTNREILGSAGLTKIKSKGRRSNGAGAGGSYEGRNDPATFYFPRSTPFKLRKAEVRGHEIAVLPFYTDLVWLVDFSLCALLVLFANDFVSFFRHVLPPTLSTNKTTSFFLSMHSFFTPSTINLNLVWSLFIVWFAMGSLFSVLRVYLGRSSDNEAKVKERAVSSSEWPLLMVTGFSSFIAAMLCLSLDVSFLDLRISPAYGNLTFSLSPEASGSSAMSWGMFQACLAFYAAMVGVLFAFPSLQYGRIYVQTLRDPESSWLTRLLFNLNLIAPQLTLLLWVVPLTARLPALLLQHAGVALGGAQMSTTWLSFVVICARALSSERICSLRLLFTLFTVILRVAMTKRHMQAFLDTAQTRLDRLNREPGCITNREVQRIVASVFHCFNFAALQYLAPAMLLIGLAFSYKASTGTGWLPLAPQINVASSPSTSLASLIETFAGQDWDLIFTASWFSALQHTREAFGELWESLRCQAGYVCQGVLGFALFWCLAAWQAVAVTGVAYHRFVD
ncbi:Transmembrane protein 161B [Echinococcus multilocularis]|uniref:Transmembrane protein 161B n=1 Tax=Echinococcus multilocularis TaxID=6211 RepID=A0A068Y524_ECHMU|nr:Transmembrane protein 161B [Echinococcus multilocularis]